LLTHWWGLAAALRVCRTAAADDGHMYLSQRGPNIAQEAVFSTASFFFSGLSARGAAGAQVAEVAKSVTGRDRRSPATEAVKAVVKPHGDHIHVLADPVAEQGRKGSDHSEVVVRMSHE
jgi:hypothetical protein